MIFLCSFDDLTRKLERAAAVAYSPGFNFNSRLLGSCIVAASAMTIELNSAGRYTCSGCIIRYGNAKIQTYGWGRKIGCSYIYFNS